MTGKRCVSRIITDLAVFDIIDEKLILVEIDPETTVDEVTSKTGAKFEVAKDLKKLRFNIDDDDRISFNCLSHTKRKKVLNLK